ncbi:MAG TPA: SDR family NAD(P)-dependent oxidoreductase [Puia sp.]
MSLKEVWFITGASTGLGLYFAKGLLQNGQRVAAVSRDKVSLQNLIGRPMGAGGKTEDLLCLTADLTDEDSVQTAIRQTIRQFGRIDGIVNYAGCDLSTPPEALPENALHQYFEENVFGTFHVLKQALPYLRSQGSGMILNYSSPATIAAAAGSNLYSATRMAVEKLSEELTAGIEDQGIQQTFIGSGIVRQLRPERIFSARANERGYAKRELPQPASNGITTFRN